MPHDFIRRATVPVLGLAAVALVATACSSSTSGSGSDDSSAPVNSSAPADSSGSDSSGGGLGNGGGSSEGNSSKSAINGGGGAAASSVNNGGDDGGGGSSAAFCQVFRDAGANISNTGTDPSSVIKLYEKLDDAAPSDIKPAVDGVIDGLHKAQNGDTSSISQISDNTKKIVSYAQDHCS